MLVSLRGERIKLFQYSHLKFIVSRNVKFYWTELKLRPQLIYLDYGRLHGK